MDKVLLIYPRFKFQDFGQIQEPLGLGYIASALKTVQIDSEIVDLMFFDSLEELEPFVKNAFAVGISSSTVLFSRALMVKDWIKSNFPSLPVVLGGPHATASPLDALKAGFDYVVIGEGEEAGVELFSALRDGKSAIGIPSVMTLKDGKPIGEERRGFIPNLDLIPFPRRELFNYKGYIEKGMFQIGIVISRGCPYKCAFCKPIQDLMFGRKFRKRSPENVFLEMKLLKEKGYNFFLFKDDSLGLLGKEWFQRLYELEEQEKVNFMLSGMIRVDELDEELVLLMKKAGIVGLAFGVESGSQKILDYYKKGIQVKDTKRAFKLCHKYNIGTHAFIMMGAPLEEKKDLEETVALVEEIKPESISISVFTPSPGTELYEKLKAQHKLKTSYCPSQDFYKEFRAVVNEKLTDEDLIWARRKMLELVPTTFFKGEQEELIKNMKENKL